VSVLSSRGTRKNFGALSRRTNRVPIGVKQWLSMPRRCCFEFLFKSCTTGSCQSCRYVDPGEARDRARPTGGNRAHIADEFQVSRAVAVDQAGSFRRFVRDLERSRTERDPVRVFEVAEEGARGAERVVLLAARGEDPEAVFRVDDQAREVLVAWTMSKCCLASRAYACAALERGSPF
jgi:hypothetical protein